MARKKPTAEDIERHQLNSSLESCKKCHVPYPSYVFKEEDRVRYGNWDYAMIFEVCDGGRYYKVFQKTANIKYGKYIGEIEEIRYHNWLELLPYRPPKEFEFISKFEEDKDIFLNFSQRDITSLFHMFYYSGIDLDTDYQRGLVWTPEQEVDLIRSIFKNIDIGKFAVIKREFSEECTHFYEMLDGKQRLTALCRFYEGRFKYRDRTFQQLHPYDQAHFKGFPISHAESYELTDKQKYRYFIKLNTTGRSIDPVHMEKVKVLLEKMKD